VERPADGIDFDLGDGCCKILAILRTSNTSESLLTVRNGSLVWRSEAVVGRLMRVRGFTQVLRSYVSGSIGWCNGAEEFHVTCVTALPACVVGFCAWIGKMPAVAVLA
jgi:hypothetical protein